MSERSAADRGPVRVLFVQYTNPAAYPPVEHGARLLKESGCEVRVLGIGALQGALVFRPESAGDVRLMSFAEPGWRQKVHYLRFCAWVMAQAISWRPHWIYASDPLSCPVALALSYLPGIRAVYHEHDSPSEGTAGMALPMRRVMWARRALARRARLCVLPNEGRSELFRRTTGAHEVLTVWNTPTRDEVIEGRRSRRVGSPLRLWFHGSIVPARVPLSLVKALAALPDDITLAIAGYETAGHPGYVAEFLGAAAAAGVERRVTVLSAMPRHRLLEACSEADLGISFGPLDSADVNERMMVGASNKPFDYMARGLALVVSDLPEWRATFVERGFGLACNPESVPDLVEAIRWFRDHRAETACMGERGAGMIRTTWNYEQAFRPVIEIIRGGANVVH